MSSATATQKENSAILSRVDLEELIQREAKPGSPVLSVYLDTDQSREINIERGFEVVLKDMLREIRQNLDKEARQEFDADAERVQQFVEEYRDVKRAITIFCDASDQLLWYRELNVRLRNGARWDEKPYVRPLLELFDEYERYGVVLTDRKQARFFTIFMGQIEEHSQSVAQLDVTHINAPGTDHIESQLTIQHKAEQNAQLHLKSVAETTARLANVREFDRLILAGPLETTSEVFGLLPKALRAKVVRQMSLPINGSDALVFEETLKVEAEIERAGETELVERLLDAAQAHRKAVAKLTPTVRAIQEQRVWQLIYADGFAPSGSQCGTCKALFAEEKANCDYCGQAVKGISDFIDRAVERVLDMQGRVEEVRGPAAERLEKHGSIGAFLRW
jgi:peptide subunit release factor 1 (eRF1)